MGRIKWLLREKMRDKFCDIVYQGASGLLCLLSCQNPPPALGESSYRQPHSQNSCLKSDKGSSAKASLCIY